MSILHTVNKSPFEKNSLESCLNHVKDGSAILLLEDGVYGALNNTAVSDRLARLTDNIRIYALSPDIKARGLHEDRLVGNINLIAYDGFVDLAAEHDLVQAWL